MNTIEWQEDELCVSSSRDHPGPVLCELFKSTATTASFVEVDSQFKSTKYTASSYFICMSVSLLTKPVHFQLSSCLATDH